MLEVVPTLVTKDSGEERQHDGLLSRELETKRADGIDNDDFELVGDIGHEGRDLLHQSVDRSLVTSLHVSQACMIYSGLTLSKVVMA
jgi:hypothetical protein